MASLSTTTDGEMMEFKARLSRAGLTAEMLREVNRHDDMAPLMVEALKGHRLFTLIHGVFNRQDYVLSAFKTRCADKGIDFRMFSWDGSELAPEFDLRDPETAVVLDATLGTLKETFEFAWEWTLDGQGGKGRRTKLDSVFEAFTLLGGIEFRPWTLKWVRIKLDTNIGRKPVAVRDPNSSPGCALLFMSAEHPERIMATDYEKRYGFYLPGLQCSIPGHNPWTCVPYVEFVHAERRVDLGGSWCGYGDASLAVPVLRK